jgi:hypothetical protein
VVSESPRGSWIRAEFAPDDKVATGGIIALLAELAGADQE